MVRRDTGQDHGKVAGSGAFPRGRDRCRRRSAAPSVIPAQSGIQWW